MTPAMTLRLGDTQHRLLVALRGAPGGLGVEALSQALGITVTAVRQHLVALERDGLVARTSVPQARGRPAHAYTLTTSARETFTRQYPWFSALLLGSLRDALGVAGLKAKLHALGREAAGAAPKSAPFEQRVQALSSRMTELGYEATVEGSPRAPEITAHNCVFHQLAEANPEVCSFDLGLMSEAAGAKVSHEECLVRGGAVCRFALQPLKSK
jgi:predicted ArsR family transcriptional regulator